MFILASRSFTVWPCVSIDNICRVEKELLLCRKLNCRQRASLNRINAFP